MQLNVGIFVCVVWIVVEYSSVTVNKSLLRGKSFMYLTRITHFRVVSLL